MATVAELNQLISITDQAINELRERIAQRERSLANVSDKFQANAAYRARLQAEIVQLKVELAAQQTALSTAVTLRNQAQQTAKKKVSPKVDPEANQAVRIADGSQLPPYDDNGNLNPGWAINDENGQPYYTGNTVTAPSATPVNTNQNGEGFGNVFPDGFGGFVNGDGQPVDANGSLIPTGNNVTESAALVDANNSGEGFGNVFPDGFGGFVNGDGQPVDANGSLIPTGDNLTQSAALVDPGTGGEGFSVTPDGDGGYTDAAGNPVDQFGMPIEAVQPTTYPPAEVDPLSTGYTTDAEQIAAANIDAGGATDSSLGAAGETLLASRTANAKNLAKQQATIQARYKQPGNQDWRVRLSLGPGAQYLYNATPAGVLKPLAANGGTDGVIFPYTPNITTTYSANYEQYDLTHSNYRGIFYKNSRVGDIQLRGTFTAQDTTEANYLLAVIHFFRSVTKMFYGQDEQRGTPPPICLLNGYGGYQFSDHPVVVSSFNYSLPNDVDYIRTTNPNNFGLNLNNRYNPSGVSLPAGGALAGLNRLLNAIPGGLNKGALPRVPAPNTVVGSVTNNVPASYVPTKMEIDITLIPVQTRSQVSQQFSLKGFANGDLLKGGFW